MLLMNTASRGGFSMFITYKNNKGYSLIELIIVIAIIAIVSTMSLISINVLFSAKVKADAQTFNAEIGLLKEDRYTVPTDKITGNVKENCYKSIRLYQNTSDGRLYIQKTYYDPEHRTTNIEASENRNGTAGLKLTSYTSVTFVEQKTGATFDVKGGNDVRIVFNKDGTVHLETSSGRYLGAGKFIFKKRNGDTVANVYLRANGSHNVR